MLGDDDGRVLLPVLRGPAKGLWFKFDLIKKKESAYLWGRYDTEILRKIQKICKPGWTVWDCGTYLGFYTAFFARLVGSKGKVVAIEPDPFNIDRTKQNIALNGFDNVEFFQAAIGRPIGQAEFLLNEGSNSHLDGTWVWGVDKELASKQHRILVKCLSLDQLIEEQEIPAPNLIKLDIEGAEEVALKYTIKIITQFKPMIVLELHHPECDRAAWEFAKESNYSLVSLDSGKACLKREDVFGTLLCTPQQ